MQEIEATRQMSLIYAKICYLKKIANHAKRKLLYA